MLKCISPSIPGCTPEKIASGAVVGPYYQGMDPDTAYFYATQYADVYPNVKLCTTNLCNDPTATSGVVEEEGRRRVAGAAGVFAAVAAAAAAAWAGLA
jgi:hypothetical protein